MNRRDFLLPHRTYTAAGNAPAVIEEPGAAPSAAAEFALVQCGRRAMATTFEVFIPLGVPEAVAAARAALDEIDRLEAQLTVYRESSAVSGINRLAATAPVQVEERLFDLLTLCARLSEETEGAFDISVGALIKAWGFFRRQGRVPSAAERADVLTRTGLKHVMLDRALRSIRFTARGLEINFGSIGKGYALDRAVELLRRDWKVPAALVHGGKSSVIALGTAPGDPRGWAVRLRHPWDTRRCLGTVRLRDRALGTSAATFQHLEHEGRKLGHILDPRTGWPAEGMASASVLAPTAAEADALATAFFIQGVEWARGYCAVHPAIGAVLLPADLRARPVILGLGTHDFSLGSS